MTDIQYTEFAAYTKDLKRYASLKAEKPALVGGNITGQQPQNVWEIRQKKENVMAEVQQLGANQAKCWQCGAVVYKGIKTCPKCGAVSPAMSIATTRKIVSIFLPLGIVLLIAGIITLVWWYGFAPKDDLAFLLFGEPFFVGIAIFLMGFGAVGVIGGPISLRKLKKWEQQHAVTREGQ
jgi:hypothetical protein